MCCILLSAENNVLNKQRKGIKTEAMKGATVKHDRHVQAHPTNEEIATIESMRVCIRKVRMFRANDRNSDQQDIRNFGVIRQSEM